MYLKRFLKPAIQILLIFSFAFISCSRQDELIYKNPNAEIEQRVDDLLSRMSIEEKFWQLFMIPGDLSDGKEKYKHGIFGLQVSTKDNSKDEAEQILDYSAGNSAEETAALINKIQKYFVEETRLGIPIIPFDEALHGLIRDGSTMFPQSIGLAASWNTELMKDVSAAIAWEVKSRGIRQVLSPVINIARDVRWGRTEETYGEDPFLTTQMAMQYVSAFENMGIITTPKHFVANVGDGGRDSYPIHFNERILEEIYFPAFKSVIQKAGARSIMTSYNSLDGRQCTANNWLLNKKLKHDWGFKGFVISDVGATGGANVLHFTAKDYSESTEQAIENGLDVVFQTSYDHYPLFIKAFEDGTIPESAIDSAVKRVLNVKFQLGLFENPYVKESEIEKSNDLKTHKILARKAARESVVLLKNNNAVLPFNKKINSIAVIGQDAAEARLGGYSGPGNNPVSILQGIKNKLGNTTRINYSPGCGRNSEEFTAISPESLFCVADGKKTSGLVGEYFNNINLDGQPELTRVDNNIDFKWTLFSPDQKKINFDYYSVRWTGKLVSDKTGNYEIGIRGDDGYRIYINDKLIIDNWRKQTVRQITESYYFEKNKIYDIKVEFYETVGNVNLKLIWNQNTNQNWKKEIKTAVAAAEKCDAAVVCVGIEEGEFRDRAFLSLPGHQEELINSIAAIGKPLVVILVGGSAVTMQNWIDNVPAIIDVWYPGDEGGNAIADVLFGDYNPAGRLPITFPVHESQLPLYYNHKPTGRGDDYVNLTGKALFPFGYGLSYTKFEYSDFQIDDPVISKNQKTTVRFMLSNIGKYDGDEVVQLYIKDLFASVARPVLELKGFKRVHLKKGETKEVTFEISHELLSMLNEKMERVVEPGDFRIMIGASSNDIRLRGILKVEK